MTQESDSSAACFVAADSGVILVCRTFHSPVELDGRRHLCPHNNGPCDDMAAGRVVAKSPCGRPSPGTTDLVHSIVVREGSGSGETDGNSAMDKARVRTPGLNRTTAASCGVVRGQSPKDAITCWRDAAVLVTLLFFFLSVEMASAGRNYRFSTNNVTALLDGLLAKDHYDYRIRPDFGGPPVLVTVNMHIKSMGPVSEMDELYVMDCYFRQVWYDRRLSFNFSGLTEFSMSWLFLERIWKPDTFFTNGKKSYLHRITVPNKFIRLRNDGFLTYSMRLTILARCRMHLRKFPLDSQACPLFIGSYGYTSKDVLYQWQVKGSVGLEPGVELAQYDLVSIATEGEAMEKRGNDSYSVIRVFFFLKRHTGYFMLQVYVPCGLIVSCSWVSFWIDPDAVPARVSLGVTTVLSMTTMGFGGRAQMPKVSYATALDWFVILCFSFVFAVMVEYAAINFIDKIRTDVKRKAEEDKKKAEEERKRREAEEAEEEEQKEREKDEDEEERKKRVKKEQEEGAGLKEGIVTTHAKRPTNFGASNVLLGGVGDHDVVRVIVESVDEDPLGQKVVPPPPPPPPPGASSRGGGVGARAGVGHVTRDNIDWDEEADEYDEYTDEELDVVGNGGPDQVAELMMLMAVSESADRLGVGCDADIGRGADLRRGARSVTASPVDAPKWQHTLMAPIRAWRSSRMFTKEEFGSVMMFLGVDQSPNGRGPEGSEALVPAGKFSKIDITSRRLFPIMFFGLITIYWIAYMYYITDEYQAEGWHTTGEDGIGPRRNVVFVAGENN
ncbi:gamma-aminobutyric acid receptor subunit alpha-6-like [Ischnura elegans]|uniref:gamma-aminobutyric acid receptor subunit alpha-6-like n=1 Tax=Ischnura elegans TaxID=197161 RepID=UPI001ED868A0|nr:gamma-aminobutyric acid receptor subunit alpha-6-like [Ischnura elegans]